jgi:hypothetical protein
MNPADCQTQLQKKYLRENWHALLRQLLPGVEIFEQPQIFPLTNDREKEIATARRQFGAATLADGKRIAFYEIDVKAKVDLLRNRVALRELVARCIDEVSAHAVLAFFVHPDKQFYRLTYAAKESKHGEDLKIQTEQTATRRFTYILGQGEKRRTAAIRLAALSLKNTSAKLNDVTDAFSVEKVNREFFDTYKQHYQKFCEYLIAGDAPLKVFDLQLRGLDDKARDHALKPVRDFVKKLLGRLVFLHFLQKKGWLGCPANVTNWKNGDPDFIRQLFVTAPEAEQKRFHSRRLVPLYFNTLNRERPDNLFEITGTRVPYLNGGLFERDFDGVEKIDFPPELFANLLEFFGQYNFTIDENDPDDHEIGIDPEMLGQIFENLLEDNKNKGAFYTPKAVVQYMCQQSLIHALCSHFPGDAVAKREIEKLIRTKEPVDARQDSWLARHATQLSKILDELRICDPAIGSGAFPIGMLQEIYWTKLALNPSLDRATAKRDIIQRSIYGVDIDAGAVEIARLRFWLALIVEEKNPVPLPNLDYQIMQGNSLLESFEGIDLSKLDSGSSGGHELTAILGDPQGQLLADEARAQMEMQNATRRDEISKLLHDYFNETKPEAKTAFRQSIDGLAMAHLAFNIGYKRDEIEVQLRQQRALLAGKRVRKKGWSKDACERAIASLENELAELVEKGKRLGELEHKPERPFFLWHLWFRHVLKAPPAGRGGFDIVIANPPYIPMETMEERDRRTFQARYLELKRKYDSAAVFILHALELLNENGCITFITPQTWQTGENYAELRKTLFTKAGISCIVNLPFDIFVEAYVDTCIFVATRKPTTTYRISILPKKSKSENLLDVTSIEISKDLIAAPNYKVVLAPRATELVTRIKKIPGMRTLGDISKSTQGLAGNRFKRLDAKASAVHMQFAEEVSVSRYAVNVQATSIVDMGEHRSLKEYYVTEAKLLIRRIISRQDRLIVARFDEPMVFKKDVSPFLLTDKTFQASFVLAMLNSQLLSWIYVNTSSIATKDDFRQTTLAELRTLPIPAASAAEQAALSGLVDGILAAKRTGDAATVTALEAEIDTHVFRLYALTPAEIDLVKGTAK